LAGRTARNAELVDQAIRTTHMGQSIGSFIAYAIGQVAPANRIRSRTRREGQIFGGGNSDALPDIRRAASRRPRAISNAANAIVA
jgi:hypothetical protein